MSDEKRRMPAFRLTRDGLLFVGGMAGIAHETLVTNGERPTLLVAFLAMAGLPAFLRTDEKIKPPDPPAKPESEGST